MKQKTVRLILSVLICMASLSMTACGGGKSPDLKRESMTRATGSATPEPESAAKNETPRETDETKPAESADGTSGGGILTGDPDTGVFTPYY